VTPLADGWCEIEGRRLRNFAGNDYLNLSHDPRVMAAACEAARQGGAGVTASALVTGRSRWHVQLEATIAEFLQQPAAILFPTGYAANVGTITALAGPKDVIFCERLNHASLVDGCRLSGARLRVFRHTELAKLERSLERDGNSARRRLIVTDSLFSMDGVAAPLDELASLAERHDALLVVDEAHAFGVLGENGCGLVSAEILKSARVVRIATLSKAVGSLGGFVAGERDLIDWLWNRARPQMFSTTLPPSACAAAETALRLIQQEPWRREAVLSRAAELRAGLKELGQNAEGIGPIVPIMVRDARRAVELAGTLEDAGFVVAAIRPPTVPQETSRLRITLSAAHSADAVGELLRVLRTLL